MADNSSYVEALFGKPLEKVVCQDIRAIIEAETVESPFLEFKAPTPETKRKDLAKLITKSIIAFLNSDKGEGLLILGIKERKNTPELVGVPPELVGNDKDVAEKRIRDWIIKNIDSVPPSPLPQRIYVKVFHIKEDCAFEGRGYIILIYVKRTFDAVYFSKDGGIAYIREGSRSRQLRADEIALLLGQKRKPQMIALLESCTVTNNKIMLRVLLYNVGSKPATVYFVRLIITPSAPKCHKANSGEITRCLGVVTIKLAKKPSQVVGLKETEQVILIDKGMTQPFTLPIFPRIPAKAMEIELELKGNIRGNDWILIPTSIYTFTEDTYTQQRCIMEINVSANKSQQKCLHVIIKDYVTMKTIFEKTNALLVYDPAKGLIISPNTPKDNTDPTTL